MIDERMEEQASLHVLGMLTNEEQAGFETELSRSAELQQLVEELRRSRDAMAGAVPPHEPSAGLRQRILAQVAPRSEPAARPAQKEMSPRAIFWLPWAFALFLAAACVLLIGRQMRQEDRLSQQAARLQALNQMADGLRNETNALQQMVTALRETNRLENLRIAMLNSLLADSPKTIAVSLWDNEQQKGVFVVHDLKPLPSDKDYQLWVMDPKYPTPVSAGVFQVDAQGNVRIQFKAAQPIGTADKFAVTMEPKGGLPTPTLKNLVLLGG